MAAKATGTTLIQRKYVEKSVKAILVRRILSFLMFVKETSSRDLASPLFHVGIGTIKRVNVNSSHTVDARVTATISSQ